MPGPFKLDHLQLIEPIYFQKIFYFFTFILGGQFLLPLKAINGKRKREFSKLIRHIINRNFALRRRLDSYHVMVDKEEAADILLRTAPPQGKKWSAFLKIDCGNKGPRTVHKRRSLQFSIFLHFF